MANAKEGGKQTSIGVLMASLLVAIFAFQLNASMLSPALVTMANELGVPQSDVAMSQTVFFTAAALFSLFLPRLADLKGRKKVLGGMLIATMLGCLISAIAPNMTILNIGRILEGVSGPVVPLCLIMLHTRVEDKARYARLMAILTSVNGGIGGVDALLGGWLASNWGYRSVFLVMGLVCIAAVLMIFIFADESKDADTDKMDWLGVFFLVVAVGCALLAIDEIQKLAAANWAFAGIMIVVAIIAFILFWRTENHVEHPMVTTKYLKQRRTWALLSTTLCTMTGVFAIMNGIVPALAQDAVAGVGIGTAVASFYTLTPYALAGLLFGPVAGILASKFGYRGVLRGGLILTVIGVVFGIYLANTPSIWALLTISIFVGVTYAGTTNIMLNGLGIVLSPKDNTGYLPGLNAGAFNLGAGVSFVVLYSIQNVFGGPATTSGYVAAFVAGAVLLCIALALSFLIPDPEHADE